MNAVDFHSAIATEFDRRYELSEAFRERYCVWTALFDRYVMPGDRVIDLGCGSGVFSTYLAKKGCIVIGVDGSEKMINLCNQKRTSASERYIVQSLPLPLAAEAAYTDQNVIIASSVLEYMDDMPGVLQQAQRILRPGGILMLSMPNQQSIYRRIERWVFMLTGYPRYFAHLRNVSTVEVLDQQLSTLGFALLDVAYFSNNDLVSKLLKRVLPKPYVNNLFVGVYQKL